MRTVIKGAVALSMFIRLIWRLSLLAGAVALAYVILGVGSNFVVVAAIGALFAIGLIDLYRRDLRAEMDEISRVNSKARRASARRSDRWGVSR